MSPCELWPQFSIFRWPSFVFCFCSPYILQGTVLCAFRDHILHILTSYLSYACGFISSNNAVHSALTSENKKPFLTIGSLLFFSFPTIYRNPRDGWWYEKPSTSAVSEIQRWACFAPIIMPIFRVTEIPSFLFSSHLQHLSFSFPLSCQKGVQVNVNKQMLKVLLRTRRRNRNFWGLDEARIAKCEIQKLWVNPDDWSCVCDNFSAANIALTFKK